MSEIEIAGESMDDCYYSLALLNESPVFSSREKGILASASFTTNFIYNNPLFFRFPDPSFLTSIPNSSVQPVNPDSFSSFNFASNFCLRERCFTLSSVKVIFTMLFPYFAYIEDFEKPQSPLSNRFENPQGTSKLEGYSKLSIENSDRYCTEFSIWIILKRSHTSDRIIHKNNYFRMFKYFYWGKNEQ